MSSHLRLLYTLCGLILHCLILCYILYVVIMTDNERLAWEIFLSFQLYTVFLWSGLCGLCFLLTNDTDLYYQYGAGWLVSVGFNWLSKGSYDRDIITICANQVGQVTCRYLIARWMAPVPSQFDEDDAPKKSGQKTYGKSTQKPKQDDDGAETTAPKKPSKLGKVMEGEGYIDDNGVEVIFTEVEKKRRRGR